MKSIALIILASLTTLSSFSQKEEVNVFTKVEIEANPDSKHWKNYLNQQTQLPESVSKDIPAGSYKAVIRFIVDVHGYLGQFTIKTDPGHGLGKRALEIIQRYDGKWSPANQCGRNVKAYREQVVVFEVKTTHTTDHLPSQ